MRRVTLSALVACSLGIASCGPSDTAVRTAGGTVTTSKDGSTTTVTGPNGQVAQFGAGANVANAQLPDFLPLYPGAKVSSSVVTSPDVTTRGGSVAFETAAPVSDVVKFYKDKAAARGLTEALNLSEADGMTYMASKDKTMIQVIATKGTQATAVVLSWTAPK
jgi:hypothetical protein